MNLEIDADVKAVAEFMQANIAASRLVGVATAIGRLAPILWGRYSADDVQALSLAHEQCRSTENATSLSVATVSGRPVDAAHGSELAAGASALM